MKRMTFTQFLTRAKAVHGERYDWFGISWIDAKSVVYGKCVEHGEFHALPSNVYKGYGCPDCGKRNRADGRARRLQEKKVAHENSMANDPVYRANYIAEQERKAEARKAKRRAVSAERRREARAEKKRQAKEAKEAERQRLRRLAAAKKRREARKLAKQLAAQKLKERQQLERDRAEMIRNGKQMTAQLNNIFKARSNP